MALKYLADLPYADEPEVVTTALSLFHSARAAADVGGGGKSGNAALLHAEVIAKHVVLTNVLWQNEGGYQGAILYAKAASLLAMLAYFSGMAQNTVTIRTLLAQARTAAR